MRASEPQNKESFIMAIENAKQFVEKVQADAALAERVKGM